MADIKTRDAAKKTIKTIRKAALAGERMKSAYARTKRKVEPGESSGGETPEGYAADRFLEETQTQMLGTAKTISHAGYKGVKRVRKNSLGIKPRKKEPNSMDVEGDGKGQKAEALKKPIQEQTTTYRRRDENSIGERRIKTLDRTHTAVKTADCDGKAGQRPIKLASPVSVREKEKERVIKTMPYVRKSVERSAGIVGEAVPITAGRAQKSAQAMTDTFHRARAAFYMSRKKAVFGSKRVLKALGKAAKTGIGTGRAVLSALFMGSGMVAVALIAVICFVGLLTGSCFGIFFSSEDSGTGQTMQTAVNEIHADYRNQLEEIQANTVHDTLEILGSCASWREVLAVYAVKMTTDPDRAMDVSTVDDFRKEVLRDIFWHMNEISFWTETETETVIRETEDNQGNPVEEEIVVTRTVLYITVAHKTAEEMADLLRFDCTQRRQLEELLVEENRGMWSQVFYGIGSEAGEIVTVALSQLGNVGGELYWSWYGFGSHVEWCACFVSWCANECGYLDQGIIPKFSGCVNGAQWFKERGQWQERSCEPAPGQIIFFDWNQDGVPDHVGLVEKCENGIIYTVEGNSGNACRQQWYAVGSSEIYGYGLPAY